MEASITNLIKYYPKGSYLLSISGKSGEDFSGSVYFPSEGKAYSFSSAWNMLKQIEDDINHNRFPQCTFEPRRWFKKQNQKSKTKKPKNQAEIKASKPLSSFLIHIQYCRGATWQGSVQWMEGKQAESFRSQFELLQLIEEALH